MPFPSLSGAQAACRRFLNRQRPQSRPRVVRTLVSCQNCSILPENVKYTRTDCCAPNGGKRPFPRPTRSEYPLAPARCSYRPENRGIIRASTICSLYSDFYAPSELSNRSKRIYYDMASIRLLKLEFMLILPTSIAMAALKCSMMSCANLPAGIWANRCV